MSNLLLFSSYSQLQGYMSNSTRTQGRLYVSRNGQYLAYNSGNANTIYLSSDYGNTLNPPSGIPTTKVSGVGYSPTGQYILLVSGTTVYSSKNYGVTWQTYTYAFSSTSDMNIAISLNAEYIYVCSGGDANIYLSTTFGQSWSLVNATLPSSVSNFGPIFCDNSGKYLIATTNTNNTFGVISSRNYAMTWTAYPFTTTLQATVRQSPIAINSTGQYMYICTNNQTTPLSVSNDFGVTWKPWNIPKTITLPYGGQGGLCCDPTGSTIYAILQISRSSFVYIYSLNYGSTFNTFVSPLQNNLTFNADNVQGIFYTGNQQTCLYQMSTGGLVYKLFANFNGLDSYLPKIASQRFLTQSNFISGGHSPWSTLNSPSAIWASIACNSDSSILVGANTYPDQPGYIHISTNSGATWTQTSAPILRWVSVSCDQDCCSFFACTNTDGNSNSGVIYYSSTAGSTWIKTSAPGSNYTCVTCDIAGVNVYACSSDYTYGYIYGSSNGGSTWRLLNSTTNYWSGITCNSTGTFVAACINSQGVYTSSNSGTTWTNTSLPPSAWCSISCDSTGQYLVVADCAPGTIYASSDYGSTWVQSSSPYIQWSGIKSSGDGKYVVASAWNDYIYISSDYGLSWKQTNSEQRGWSCVTSSYSGYYILAGDNNPGYIYSSTVSMDMSRISGPIPLSTTSTTMPLTNFLISPSIKPISIYNVIYPTSNGQSFYSICSSRNGQYIYCVAQDLGIVGSTNYGSTWRVLSARSVGSYVWLNIACNYSGQYVVASTNYNASAFYVSSNYGTTWTPSNIPAASDVRLTVTMNDTGSVVIVGGFQIYNNTTGNRQGAFISTNYGSTWRNITSLPQNILGVNTNSAACDSSGTYIYSANNNNGIISVSTNSGSTFTTTLSGSNVFSVACSNTGQYVVTAANSYIYTSSTYGSSWVQRSSTPGGFRVASDSTGQYLTACTNGGNARNGNIYKSSNYGATWNIVQNTYSGYTVDNYNSLSITDDNSVIACAYGASASLGALGTIYSEKTSNTDLLYAFQNIPYTLPAQLTPLIPNTIGLVNYYNFMNPDSYSGSGSNVKNLITSTSDMSLINSPVFDIFTNTMIFLSSNNQCMQISNTSTLQTFQTVSIWYQQLAGQSSVGSSYLFDGRNIDGTNNNSWIGTPGISIASNWTEMYVDGGSYQQPIWTSTDFQYGTWHNLTFTASSPIKGNLTFFGRFNKAETTTIQVAVVMVYNRKITQEENAKNNNFIVSNYISKLTTPSLLYLLSPSISTGSYFGVEVSENRQYVLLCSNSGIARSSNSGSTFSFNTTITSSQNSSSPVMSTSGEYMYFILQSRGPTIYKSSNYGSTWVSNNIGSAISKIRCNSSGSSVWAIEYTTGAIYQSTNYGTTYTTIYTIGANLNLVGLEYNATLNNLYITSANNGRLYFYNLTSNTLTSVAPSTNTICSGVAVSNDGKNVYISFGTTTVNQVYYSNFYGLSWRAVTLPNSFGDPANNFGNGIYCSSSGQYVYTSDFNAFVFYSNNYGANWYAVRLPVYGVNLSGISTNNSKNILSIYYYNQYYTADLSQYPTPTPIPTPTQFDLSFSSMNIPMVDSYGNNMVPVGNLSIVYDYIRTTVVYMSDASGSFYTDYATPSTFTRSFWYNPIAYGGQMNTVSSNNLKMYFNNTSYMTVVFNPVSGTSVTLTDTTIRGANVWTHYALTYDGTTATLYVNGTSVASDSTVVYIGETGTLNAGGLCIGDYNSTRAGTPSGAYFDMIHTYNTAYSSSQITAMYNSEYKTQIYFNNVQLGLSPSTLITKTNAVWGISISQNGQYIVTSQNGNSLWTSSNGGATFVKTYTQADNFRFSASSYSGKYVYVAAAYSSKIYCSSDYGFNWSVVSLSETFETSICCNYDGSKVWYVNALQRQIFQSTDYGNSFSLLYNTSIPGLNNISYNLSLDCIYFASRVRGSVYQYSLKTMTQKIWTPDLDYTDCFGCSVSDNGQYMYISYNARPTNQVYYSSNYGSTWTGVTIPTQSGDTPTQLGLGIFCSPSGQYVYTAFFTGRYLYYSSNYGVSWNYKYYYTQMNSTIPNGICLNSYKNKLMWWGNEGFIIG